MSFYGYLFTYFTGEDKEHGEQVYFATSRDGLHWTDLNSGKPIITSSIGQKGLRDAFVLRYNDKFVILATDLKIHGGNTWYNAVHNGSTKLAVIFSDNLTDWSTPILIDTNVDGAGCAWAPEAIFDKNKGEYLVYWAAHTKKAGKHIVYAAYTKDFTQLSAPFEFCQRECDVIDTAVFVDNNTYYRISKNETEKTLMLEKSQTLNPKDFQRINSDFLDNLHGVEGPCSFVLPSGEWCIMADRFLAHTGYLPIKCTSLENGKMAAMSNNEFDFGNTLKRHGSVLAISKEEYLSLQKVFGNEEIT